MCPPPTYPAAAMLAVKTLNDASWELMSTGEAASEPFKVIYRCTAAPFPTIACHPIPHQRQGSRRSPTNPI